MKNTSKVFVIIALLITVGCSGTNKNEEIDNEIKTATVFFTGTIQKINGELAIVHAYLGGGEGDVFVDLSVNSEEVFQVGDVVKVGYDGMIRESHPAQINTISVERTE